MASSSSFNPARLPSPAAQAVGGQESRGFAAAFFLDRMWPPEVSGVWQIVGRIIFALSLVLFLFGFLAEAFSLGQVRFFLGLTLLSLAFLIKMFLFSHSRACLT